VRAWRRRPMRRQRSRRGGAGAGADSGRGRPRRAWLQTVGEGLAGRRDGRLGKRCMGGRESVASWRCRPIRSRGTAAPGSRRCRGASLPAAAAAEVLKKPDIEDWFYIDRRGRRLRAVRCGLGRGSAELDGDRGEGALGEARGRTAWRRPFMPMSRAVAQRAFQGRGGWWCISARLEAWVGEQASRASGRRRRRAYPQRAAGRPDAGRGRACRGDAGDSLGGGARRRMPRQATLAGLVTVLGAGECIG